MKVVGVVRFSDLEGGHWRLVSDEGESYQIDGADPAFRRDGLRVEASGRVARKGMGIGMTGPILLVTSYRILG